MQRLALVPSATLAAALLCFASLDLEASPATQFQQQATTPLLASRNGISVTGVGSAPVAFDSAIIECRVEKQAKSMLQAMTDFRAKRTLFGKAVAEFVEDGATTESEGVEIGLRSQNLNAIVMNGEAEPAAPFQASELVNVTISVADDMEATLSLIAEIVSAVDDVGCKLGGPEPTANYFTLMFSQDEEKPGPVRFVASAEARQLAQSTALAEAYKDAERQADEIAALAGGKRGLARSIHIIESVDGTKAGSGEGKKTASLAVRFDLKY